MRHLCQCMTEASELEGVAGEKIQSRPRARPSRPVHHDETGRSAKYCGYKAEIKLHWWVAVLEESSQLKMTLRTCASGWFRRSIEIADLQSIDILWSLPPIPPYITQPLIANSRGPKG